MEDMKTNYEEEIKKLQDRLRRELSARDRQIESLEEQLRHHTKIEIKKLKRGTAARQEASQQVVIKSPQEYILNVWLWEMGFFCQVCVGFLHRFIAQECKFVHIETAVKYSRGNILHLIITLIIMQHNSHSWQVPFLTIHYCKFLPK